jgi:hypothetical protein
MPGAIWKPLAADWNKQPRMRAYDFFCIHTMVGSLVGTDGYFKVGNGAGYGGTESHFGVGPDGTIYQWQDTDFQADANGNGNWHVISSENADTGAPFPSWAGSDVPPLTPQQVEANAQIAAWLYRTHGIPLGIAGSSKPGARGLAVHRYGVPGYMPAGAEQWSTARGKACPGDRRIAQLPAIAARAKQLVSGNNPTITAQGDDMAIITAPNRPAAVVGPGYFRELNKEEWENHGGAFGPVIAGNDRQWDLRRSVATSGETILDFPIPRSEKQGGTHTTLRDQAAWEDFNFNRIVAAAGDVDISSVAERLQVALAAKVGGVTRADVADALRQVLREGTDDAA